MIFIGDELIAITSSTLLTTPHHKAKRNQCLVKIYIYIYISTIPSCSGHTRRKLFIPGYNTEV